MAKQTNVSNAEIAINNRHWAIRSGMAFTACRTKSNGNRSGVGVLRRKDDAIAASKSAKQHLAEEKRLVCARGIAEFEVPSAAGVKVAQANWRVTRGRLNFAASVLL